MLLSLWFVQTRKLSEVWHPTGPKLGLKVRQMCNQTETLQSQLFQNNKRGNTVLASLFTFSYSSVSSLPAATFYKEFISVFISPRCYGETNIEVVTADMGRGNWKQDTVIVLLELQNKILEGNAKFMSHLQSTEHWTKYQSAQAAWS